MITAASKKSEKQAQAVNLDALSMLKSDHKKVTDLFDKFEKMKEGGSGRERGALVKAICLELTVHAAIEEEVFYPVVRKEIHDDDLMNEAKVEHSGAKELIKELEGMHPDDEMLNAKVKVLGEYIRHHVKEEQDEMFPKVKKTNLDLDALGSKMLKLKTKLLGNVAAQPQPKPTTSARP